MCVLPSESNWEDTGTTPGATASNEVESFYHVSTDAPGGATTSVAIGREDDMTGTLMTSTTLTAADRCDRCGAAAAVRVVLASGGELLFCGHHANQHSARLEEMAAVVHDERTTN